MDLEQPVERIRLFPLGDVVFFPHSWLPLHIFEERYRQMTRHALEGDRRIAMVLPKDAEAQDPVPIHQTACIGSIINEQELPDGRFLFLLKGEYRVRILNEVDAGTLYRQADVTPITEVKSPLLQSRRQLQRADIIRYIQKLFPKNDESMEQLVQYLTHRCTSTAFVDIVSYAAPIEAEQKQILLAEPCIDTRLETLDQYLRAKVKDDPNGLEQTFPPPLAPN